MKKNLIIVLLVIVAVLGIWYISNSGKKATLNEPVVEEEANLENENTEMGSLSIVAEESKATYEIDEVLSGKPTHVTGESSAISGNIVLNKDTKVAESATISIDANSFKTDKELRDTNVKKMVLRTDEPGNETITFEMTSVEGSPEKSLDKSVSVKINGNLKIAGKTKPVTFAGEATMSTDGKLTVSASTTLQYEDFGISVPDLPFLSNVSKDVKLSLQLVAR